MKRILTLCAMLLMLVAGASCKRNNTTYTDEEMREINRRLSEITLSGHRYNADSQKNIDSGY